jgi:hypothetical protein
MVYKVDRLSRSLLDFARLMDRFSPAAFLSPAVSSSAGDFVKRERKTEKTRELDTFSFRTRGTLAVRGKTWRSAQAGGSHHVDQALEFGVRHELFRCGGSPRRRTLLWHSSECTM